ncbi:hypothetical protein CAPTEDRAFT_219243 [Capitella teleta]|uniref:Dynein assembly factor 3 C-terminal domain-containing protein n=1 Tax=Capitella teleta TaxID=283909 RepID=R7V2R9_CAPTE|nr:hypothetical protein CAPTEDRAFT_219243 [Capitella teleta]|eukprot:ELU12844.1 hypothetical protein CAPTEDRAFT_219243 [Capitella teleta]
MRCQLSDYHVPRKFQRRTPQLAIARLLDAHAEVTEEVDEETVEEENNEDSQEKQGLMELEGIRVTFLPLGSAPDLHKKSKFQKLFNIVFFANSMVHHLNGEVNQTFADDAVVHLETSKFMLELKKEQHEEFNKKVTSIAEGVGCKSVEGLTLNHSTATFVFSATKS